MQYLKYYLVTVAIIVIDQIVKLSIHFNFPYVGYEVGVIGDWFKLHYTLNPGMAFGVEIAGEYGKLILSVFRLIAMAGIAWYLYKLAVKKAHPGLLWCIGLILGGAIGNVVDSTFYGVLLDNAPDGVPTLWFHGQVIDMFYFDICDCYIPKWVPIFGGSNYPLWPIFNVADASIFVGVTVILIRQKKFFAELKDQADVSGNNEVELDGKE